jgi:folate-binding protein YgfZ
VPEDVASQFTDLGEEDEFDEVWRMLNGIPRYNVELIPGTSIPLEFNLDWLNGIAFNKGCYLGQELIARTHFRGVIRKRLVPVFFSERAADVPLSPLIHQAGFDPAWPTVDHHASTLIVSSSFFTAFNDFA